MNVIYFETSALLAWLFGQARGDEARNKIKGAEAVVTSVLTLVEAERSLIRAEAQGILSAAECEKLRGLLAQEKSRWVLMEISEEIRARASRPFPAEPIRALDAIHLAAALTFTRIFPDLKLLSNDECILKNAGPLGIATS